MKIRGLNRKGQEVVSNFGIVGIVGIIFLVVVVLGIWYVSTRADDATTQIPENAEVIAQACSAVAREATINSYCLQFREIRSNVYATCDKMANYNIVVTDSDGSTTAINDMNTKCAQSQYATMLESKAITECSTGEYKGKSSVTINGKSCSDYISSSTSKCTSKTNVKACTEFKDSTCPSSYCTWDSTKSTCSARTDIKKCNELTLTDCANRKDDCTTSSK